MKSKILNVLAVLLAIVIIVPTISLAAPIAIGGPIEVGSWSQQFVENGVGNYDCMEAFIVSGNTDFEDPGFSGFSLPGWSGSLVNPDYILASGTSVTDMTFYITFTADQSEPFVMDFLSWEGGVGGDLKDWARATWNGGWSFALLTGESSDYRRTATSVPEPATMLLLGFGLLGLGLARRKRS